MDLFFIRTHALQFLIMILSSISSEFLVAGKNFEACTSECCLCPDNVLPDPDRTVDGVTCSLLQNSATVRHCDLFKSQFEDGCCSPDSGYVYETPKPISYDECFICGSSSLTPKSQVQTFTLEDGTYTCQELDTKGKDGRLHPDICSYIQGLLNTPTDICSCTTTSSSMGSIMSPPPTTFVPTPEATILFGNTTNEPTNTTQSTPAPTFTSTSSATPDTCEVECTSNNDCACGGYSCDWRTGGTRKCTMYKSIGIESRNKLDCRDNMGGSRRCNGEGSRQRYLRAA